MFHGRQQQKVDSRGRLAIGSFGSVSNRTEMIVALHPVEQCLRIAEQDDFQEDTEFLIESRGGADALADMLDPDLDVLRRRVFGSATLSRTDDQLRVVIDSDLLEEIAVETGDEVQVVGAGRFLEVWPLEAWREYREGEDEHREALDRAVEFLRGVDDDAAESGEPDGGT